MGQQMRDETSTATTNPNPQSPPASGSPVHSPQTFQRTVLPNGVTILGSARPESASVVVRARVRAGAVFDTAETEGLARLTALMLQRGTARYSFAELNELTDALGASISADAGRLSVELRVRCLAEDFPRLVELLAEVIRRPVFPEVELGKVRGQTIAAIIQSEQDTRAVAERGLRRLAFAAEHPYSRSVIGTRETVEALGRDDLTAAHARHYRPDALTLSVVGGVAFDRAGETLAGAFGDWQADGSAPALDVPPAAPPDERRREEFALAGKTQADIALGLPALARDNPDYYALDVANLILGRLGLYGRIGDAVRQTQGLAYYAYSSLDAWLGAGFWGARAGVSPANIERAIETILAEVRRLRDEPVRAEELVDAQDYLTGSLPLALESQDGVARLLLDCELYNLGLDYLDRYPAIIRALTREQVQAAAARYLLPDRIAVAVAGPDEGSKV
ncbi:MAG: M16 family metallopeptidase [Thermomicrobiales bacterium]